jgi:hypothetical protein
MAVPVLRGTYGVSFVYSLYPYATHKSFDVLSHRPHGHEPLENLNSDVYLKVSSVKASNE